MESFIFSPQDRLYISTMPCGQLFISPANRPIYFPIKAPAPSILIIAPNTMFMGRSSCVAKMAGSIGEITLSWGGEYSAWGQGVGPIKSKVSETE